MSEHFNGLSPAEAERLAMLAEELGEALHMIGKILRHGYESRDPTQSDTINNRAMLEMEIGDVGAVIVRMVNEGDLNKWCIDTRRRHRLARGQIYLHHQPLHDQPDAPA
jgi:hypothetical protein